MQRPTLRTRLHHFAKDSSGSLMVESIIVLPLLILMLVATFVFHDMYKFKNVRQKATFTIADMISRETQPITATYLDGAKALFDSMTRDNGSNSLRVSQVRFDASTNMFELDWSQVRGAPMLSAWGTGNVQSAHDWLPELLDGETILGVDSMAQYESGFDVGQGDPTVEARVFISPRFAPQVVYQ